MPDLEVWCIVVHGRDMHEITIFLDDDGVDKIKPKQTFRST